MPPQEIDNSSSLKAESIDRTREDPQQTPYSIQIVWRNVVIMIGLHAAALYGVTLLPAIRIWTWFWALSCFFAGGLGVTAGAHRMWCHRSYKATWTLKVLLMCMNCVGVQNDIYEWTRDHRVHHKFTETDADPHNAKRGFFFSHVGWLLVRKHPDVMTLGSKVDLSDLKEDEIVMFQRRYEVFTGPSYCVIAIVIYCHSYYSIF